MSIQAISANSYGVAPSFRGNNKAPVLVETRKNGDVEERRYEVEASTGKKWGVGIASFFVEGLGQAINGEWGKAAAFFLGSVATSVVAILSRGNLGVALAAGLAGLGIKVASIVDAVKNATSTEVQIVPAEKTQEA